MNIENVAKAIEDDAGEPLSDLRQALAEAQDGIGRVTTAEQILLRSVRTKTGLSQEDFAQRIAKPLATLRDWEQGRFVPPGGTVSAAHHRPPPRIGGRVGSGLSGGHRG